MELDSLFSYLQTKYPNHDFAWRKKGKYWVGFCPAHEDKRTPNFTIMPNEENDNDYHAFCFTCGYYEPKSENTLSKDINLIKNYLKTQVQKQKTIYLNKRIIDLFDDKTIQENLCKLDIALYTKEIFNQLQDGRLKQKLTEIGLDKDTREWLVFIYRDLKLRVTSLKFRDFIKPNTKTIKIIKLGDELGYFNTQALYSKDPFLFLVEGEFDAITTHIVNNNLYPAMALGGTSGFTAEKLKPIFKIANDNKKALFVLPDWDEAGYKTLERLVNDFDIKFLEHKKIYAVNYYNSSTKDLDELLKGKYDKANEIMNSLARKSHLFYKIKQNLDSRLQKEQEKEKQELLKRYDNEFVDLLKNSSDKLINFSNTSSLNINIDEITVAGVKIQYGAIWGLVSTTSMGKTELALDILNEHAKFEKHVSLLVEFEGSREEILYRAKQKQIDNSNFYALIKPEFTEIENFIQSNTDKKIFIVVDYLQQYARFLLAKQPLKSDNLRTYVNYIFEYFDTLRKKYSNISICLIASLSKEGIRDSISTTENLSSFRMNLLNGIKESGDIQYDLDYVYAITFMDENDKLYLSRFNSNGNNTLLRKHLKLLVLKTQRVGLKTKDTDLVWQENSAGGGNYK